MTIAQDDTPEAGPGQRIADAFADFQDDPLSILGTGVVQAIVIVFASFVIAKAADWLVTRILRRWTARTETLIDDQLVGYLHSPVVNSVIFLGLWTAAVRLELQPDVLKFTGAALATIATLLWAIFLVRASTLVLSAAARTPDRMRIVEDRTFPLFDNLAKVLIVVFAIYAVIQAWGWDATGWIASAGIIGIAVGFAAQDSLSNLFAGVLILLDAPYRVGDYINLESGERGMVVNIGLRSTRLRTRDDIEITIPNAVMGGARIVNETGGHTPKHRVRVKVSVAYGSDLARVEEILLSCTEDAEEICERPEPRVRFRTFGDSGLNIELLCWIPQPEARGRVLSVLNTRTHDRLLAAGIEIPFPKRDLYVKEMPGGGS